MSDTPTLILCAFRPTLFERRPTLRTDPLTARTVELRPLDETASEELVRLLLGVEQAPEETVRLLVTRSEGNPFYMEELIRMLVDDGLIVTDDDERRMLAARSESLKVPITLTGVLQARVDALPVAERTILQQASVIGRTFWDDALSHLADLNLDQLEPRLASLEERSMIFLRDGTTLEGTRERIFKHAIFRDVVYQTVLKEERQRYHVRAAEWLVRHAPSLESHAALIAGHLHEGGKPADAAVWFTRASRHAAGRFANQEAVELFGRALELTPAQELQPRFDLHRQREQVLDAMGDREQQEMDVEALESLGARLGPTPMAEAHLRRCNLGLVTGDYESAAAAAARAAELARDRRLRSVEARARLREGQVELSRGHYDQARSPLEQALQLAQTSELAEVRAGSLRSLSVAHHYQGRNREAEELAREALAIYQERQDLRGQSQTLNTLGGISSGQGDLGKAMEAFREAMEVASLIGDQRSRSMPIVNLGITMDQLGRYEDARSLLDEFLEIKRAIGDRPGEVWGLNHQGLLLHHLGCHDQAEENCRQALALSRELGDRNSEGSALTFLGHSLLAQGRGSEAEAVYGEALTVREQLKQEYLAAEVQAGLARVPHRSGDLPQALARVEKILGRLPADGAEEPLRVAWTCFEVLRDAGDRRADEVLELAHDELTRLADRISDPESRRSFREAVAVHRRIEEAWVDR